MTCAGQKRAMKQKENPSDVKSRSYTIIQTNRSNAPSDQGGHGRKERNPDQGGDKSDQILRLVRRNFEKQKRY